MHSLDLCWNSLDNQYLKRGLKIIELSTYYVWVLAVLYSKIKIFIQPNLVYASLGNKSAFFKNKLLKSSFIAPPSIQPTLSKIPVHSA